MLALHPKYQEKVYQEILTVMPEKDTELTQAHLDKLEFTELCIRETLRLFPTAPIIARVASKPIKLSNNVELPAGVPIVFGIRQIHIREEYYGSTVNEFNPLRFLDKDIKSLPASCYVPFSYGARNCIGDLYAIQNKIVLDLINEIFCSVRFRLLLCKSIGEMLHCAFNTELSAHDNLQKNRRINTRAECKHEISR